MTREQLQMLQHALGVDEYGQGPISRNYFCAGAEDESICRELVRLGYMETFERKWLPYYNCTVTAKGVRAMREASPKPPALTRSQRRYRRFLEHDSGLSFREWLRYYGEVRA